MSNGAPVSIEFDTTKADAALRSFGRDATRVPAATTRSTAERVASSARSLVPRVSGRLAGSIHAAPDGDDAAVTMSTDYAGWIEYGGTRGRAYVADGRYLGAAARNAENEMRQSGQRAMDSAARKV